MKCVVEYIENNKFNNILSDEKRNITVSELEISAKRIGTFLSNKIEKNAPVPIYMEKSTELLEVFFGAIYAGGFYSVINLEQPKQRIESIMNILDVDYIVTDRENENNIKELFPNIKVYLYEEMITTTIDSERLKKIREKIIDTDPVYCNFTSGSTGVPKGVLINNRSIIDFIDDFSNTFNINENDVLANQAPFDFDVSVKDIYTALKTGAKLVIIPKRLFSNPVGLIDCLDEFKVTTLIWAVSALCLVTTFHGLDYKTPKYINKVLFSGELMPIKHLREWISKYPNCMFVNLYGPTEITCNCTYYVLDNDTKYEKIPIGIPFNNEEVFLIDDNNKKITIDNVIGELCVRGTALGLGYYNNMEVTNKAFVQNPLNNKYIDLIYKTGDLAHYENGLLYCDGRRDFQIKYMGHRIELEEIDKEIERINNIDRCCTIYLSEKKKIISFYVGDIDENELNKNISKELPYYMIPTKIIKIDNFPITKNGKIDRVKLKEMI